MREVYILGNVYTSTIKFNGVSETRTGVISLSSSSKGDWEENLPIYIRAFQGL